MKRNLYRAIKSLDRINGYEPIICSKHLQQFRFCINNYSMELNDKVLKIAKSTHTTIEMIECKQEEQRMKATFKLTY